MKKIICLVLLAICLLPIHLMSRDTFYVSSTGQDLNAGTIAAPWGTLNAKAWTDGCAIVVMDEVYLDPVVDVSQAKTLKEVTIKGGAP